MTAVIGGTVLVVLSLVAWLGQVISWLSPATAVRLGVMEDDDDVEPVFAADGRGEAIWDSCTLWTGVAAGALLALGVDEWAYFGLVSGGMYLYFAGRGLITRGVMRSRRFRIGDETSVQTAFVALSVWGIAAAVTIVASIIALSPS